MFGQEVCHLVPGIVGMPHDMLNSEQITWKQRLKGLMDSTETSKGVIIMVDTNTALGLKTNDSRVTAKGRGDPIIAGKSP